MTLPRVSVLVPTRDRRRFLPQALALLDRAAWPADRLEVVVVDDGRDDVSDLVPDRLPGGAAVVFERLDARVPLGTKRNRLCALSTGDVLVHADDDDWYPPERIARAVAALDAADVDVVGASTLVVYDIATRALHQIPAAGPKHAWSNTLAYRRRLLDTTCFAPDPHGEERQFLKNWDVPLAQLPGPPWHTVVAVRHDANARPANTTLPRLALGLAEVVPDAAERAFYENLEPEDW